MSDIIATPKVTREILDRYGLKAQKKYGQNFLIDANIVAKIASQSSDKEHLTLEIGPGIGSLTQMLARYAKEVVAYEIDPKLIPLLKDNFKDVSNIHIIHEDFMDVDFKKAFYANKQINVCANLPYYITSDILAALLEARCFESVTVMVQKEVAERICAAPGAADYGAFSVFCQYHAQPEILFDVPPACFIPQPKVTSSVLHLKVRGAPPAEVADEAFFFRVVRASFAQRRKTLVNGLGALGFPKPRLIEAVAACGLPENVRGETLSIPQFAALAARLAQ